MPVVKDFIDKVRPRAIGENVIRSVTPGQQVIKIVHDVLVETLGAENAALDLGSPPAPILMVGLQGSGKTTTSAKLGPDAADAREEARADGLAGRQPSRRHGAAARAGRAGRRRHLADRRGPDPLDIAKRAMASARVGGYDVLILDTAGRQHIDEQLMAEVAAIRDAGPIRMKPCWWPTA